MKPRIQTLSSLRPYNPVMVRKVFALLLLLSVFWQAASMAGYVVGLESREDSSHVVLHWQDSAHHHHDDGTQHADNSDSTAHHMHAESGNHAAGLVTLGWRDAVALRLAVPVALSAPPHVSPHLKGPLRPPQAPA
jgi:hypothetical protein